VIEPEVDVAIVERRFERAAELTRDDETLRALLDLGLGWGRHGLVKALRARLPGVIDDATWTRFLYERALPMLPWHRAGQAVRVDRRVLSAIAVDLGISSGAAAGLAGTALVQAGTRNVGKVLDLAVIGDAPELVAWARGVLERRARFPRATLEARVGERVLQRGDGDEDDPKSAWGWLVERGGRRAVLKEHLGHPTNWAELSGRNDEPGLLASLRHPNLVRLHGDGNVEGIASFVMEYVADARPPAPTDALAVARDVASVLAALHRKDVVVFDVKPDNVLWDGRRAVLIDLGFAQRVTAEQPLAATLHGSPRAVAPEVLRRWRGGKPVDVFQLGLALFHWLTGEHAFTDVFAGDDNPGVRAHYATAILHGTPRVERLAPAHRKLVGAMLDPWPAARPTAAELFQHLLATA
jgi:hypothetical protein